jgi:hypothetical protein
MASANVGVAALLWLVPCVIAAVYTVVFVAQFSHDVWVLGWNSDFASGFTVPETVSRTGTGGHTVLGTYALYLPLWFGLLTARLPLHRQLWEAAPTLLFIVSALAIGWSVAQIAGRRAGVLASAMVLVASPGALAIFMAPVAHNTVYPCTALLGVYVIWLARGNARRRVTAIGVPLLVAVGLGVCLASDDLLVSTGLVPLVLMAALAFVRRDRSARTVTWSVLLTVLIALPIAKITSEVMSSLGYATNAPPLELAPLSTLSLHMELLFGGLKVLFNGNLGAGDSGGFHVALGFACDVVMFAAFATLLWAGVRAAVGYAFLGRRSARKMTSEQRVASLHTVYWVGSAVVSCGVFLLSGFLDAVHEAFYATLIFSVAAVLAPMTRSRSPARWLIPIGVSIFFSASLAGATELKSLPPIARYEAGVLALAKANHVTVGYGGYWDASSLTWSSHERVTVRPVYECSNPGAANLCIFPQETVPSWYEPGRRRSFLLVDKAPSSAMSASPVGLGRALAFHAFGPIRMYIYSYDIASRLGPASG